MSKAHRLIVVSSTMAICISAMAETIPDVGQLLQQQKEFHFPQPQASVKIESEQSNSIPLDQQQKVHIQHIHIVNSQSIPEAQLHSVLADAEGKDLSLSDLQKLAQRITDYYQQHGFPFNRAYLPEQTLTDGNLIIKIIEAKYGQIKTQNHSRTSQYLINSTLASLKPRNVIETKSLQQQLKLLNRLDGVQTRNIVSVGQQSGTSNLTVDLQPTAFMTGYVGFNNYGNQYTNREQYNIGASLHNLLGLGDNLSVEGSSSGNLNYGKLSYEATINGQGTRLGTSYLYLNYELGKEYKVLDATGSAKQFSLWLSQPILLTNTSEVLLNFQYDLKQLADDIQQVDIYRRRDIHIGSIRLNVSQYDQWATGGLNQLGLSTDFGYVDFRNSVAEQSDQITAKTQGEFYSLSAFISRLQNLGSSNFQLYGLIQAQYSPNNLDSAEQFSVGGPYKIAGYKSSVLSGSSGYYALGELRYGLWETPKNKVIGKLYLDTAQVTRQATKWNGFTGENNVRISSAGLAFDWYNALKWQAQIKIGFPIGKTPQIIQQKDHVETWFNLVRYF